MTFSAIIVAAGSGLRAGPGAPKAWRVLASKPILRWSVEAFLRAGAQDVILVVASDRLAETNDALAGLTGWRAVAGGETRSASVEAGLAALERADTQPVLVHDAARPFLTTHHVETLLAALEGADGAVPALPVADTLKRGDGFIAATVEREGLHRVQTPQAFRLGFLRQAYATYPAGRVATDDAGIAEHAGGRVALVPGDPLLMKLTYPEDFAMAETLAGARRITRVGLGVDAHRFGPGDSVWLCGVEIPHTHGLVGHSDADCGLHAITDALLGAVSMGDIGQHFPPSDPQWKGAASDRFLRHAADLARGAGAQILAVDVTLVCERPKIGPHREAMQTRVAQILDLPVGRVSVKATTTEKMGFTGREEGLMAQAVVTVDAPL